MFRVIAILLLLRNFDETSSIVDAVNIKNKLKNITIVNDSIAVVVVDIVKTCFHQRHDKIIVAGNWTDFVGLHRLLTPHLSVNLIALSQSKIFERHKRRKSVLIVTEDVVRKLHYPGKLFILSVLNESMNELFERLRDSTLWNSRAMFLLVNEDLDGGCWNVTNVLRIAWSFNVLTAVYVCRDSKGRINFFDFNPFANAAKGAWEVADVVIDEDRGHPFVVYRLLLDSEVDNVTPTICQALHHDKTIQLDGYPIRLGASQMRLMFQLTTTTKPHYELSDFTGRDAWIARLLWDKLQAKLIIQLYLEYGILTPQGEPHGVLKDVIEGRVDMILNQYYYGNYWQQQTYPHWSSGICMITRRKGVRFSIVNRLMMMSKVKVVVIVLITWLVVAMTFKSLMRMGLVEALIVVLHMLLGTATGHTRIAINHRFFVTSITLLMYCLNLHIQSGLTSTFMASSNVGSIDSVAEFLHSNLSLYGDLFNRLHLHDTRVFHRYHNSTVSQCLHWLGNGIDVACAENCYLATEYYKRMKEYLHVSRESISKVDLTFATREDWPLLKRVDDLVKRLREGGMYTYMRNMEMVSLRGKGRQMQEKNRNGSEQDYVEFEAKPMTLEVLGFGWYVLGVGFVLAFIVIVVEISVEKWSRRKWQMG